MADNSGEDGNNLQLLRVNHGTKITEALESMLVDESLCDISICCCGQVVKAHRVILAANSAYFKQILSGINQQTQYPIIFVSGIEIADLKAMLDFMYRGEVTIPQTQLPSLIKGAETLGISGLSQLDPNAPKHTQESPDKSGVSSPVDSPAAPTKRGRKRKKVLPKDPNEVVSDSETQTKAKSQTEEMGEEFEEVVESDASKGTEEKLAKSKLRSWSQQIAFKANHKEGEDTPQLSETESHSQSVEELERSSTVSEGTGTQAKKDWRHSRARRPPMKYSEYTLPKSIQEVKPPIECKTEPKDPDSEELTAATMIKPPSPRLTRGRSRVHSSDDPKSIISREDPMDTTGSSVSNSSETLDSSAALSLTLTPNTRSRRQTHSPSEAKDIKPKELKEPEALSLSSELVEEESPQGSSSQTRLKTPVKSQNPMSTSSLLKWRPKDPEAATTSLTFRPRPEQSDDPSTDLDYLYEAIQADGPPVYKCSYCMHSFRSKQNIIDHIKSVHIKSAQRYACPLCLKEFKWKTSLNNHLNQMHPHSRPTPQRHFDKSRKTLP